MSFAYCLPQHLRHRIYCLRAHFYFCRTGVGMIHVPKSAGTSLARELYGRSLGHFPLELYQKTLGPLSCQVPIFAVLRDPVDRFLSAFRFFSMRGTRDAGMTLDDPRSDLWRQDLDRFLSEYIDPTPELERDYIFRPQVSFVTPHCHSTRSSLQLFPLHAMDNIAQWLAHHTGRTINIPHANRSATSTPISLSSHQRHRIQLLFKADQELFDAL